MNFCEGQVFLLLVFGFYPTDNIVQAKKGGVTKSDGDWTVFGTDMYSNVNFKKEFRRVIVHDFWIYSFKHNLV